MPAERTSREHVVESFRLGIDVGGTNTDAVILDASTKSSLARSRLPHVMSPQVS